MKYQWLHPKREQGKKQKIPQLGTYKYICIPTIFYLLGIAWPSALWHSDWYSNGSNEVSESELFEQIGSFGKSFQQRFHQGFWILCLQFHGVCNSHSSKRTNSWKQTQAISCDWNVFCRKGFLCFRWGACVKARGWCWVDSCHETTIGLWK